MPKLRTLAAKYRNVHFLLLKIICFYLVTKVFEVRAVNAIFKNAAARVRSYKHV